MQSKTIFQSALDTIKPTRKQIVVKSQMPDKQIELFLNQAIQSHYDVTLQLNPTKQYDRYIEISGQLYVIGEQKQIILQSSDKVMTFFINPETVRHISRQK